MRTPKNLSTLALTKACATGTNLLTRLRPGGSEGVAVNLGPTLAGGVEDAVAKMYRCVLVGKTLVLTFMHSEN